MVGANRTLLREPMRLEFIGRYEDELLYDSNDAENERTVVPDSMQPQRRIHNVERDKGQIETVLRAGVSGSSRVRQWTADPPMCR